uniref:LO4 n=1 Tax=Barramundi adomavirus TaxID=2609870 RepID=A0A6F9F0F0_9VIRU|nr:TPA_asm: LO4 [Barramundi adomavirus]
MMLILIMLIMMLMSGKCFQMGEPLYGLQRIIRTTPLGGDKEITVTVQPQITVPSPEIKIEPNILPSEVKVENVISIPTPAITVSPAIPEIKVDTSPIVVNVPDPKIASLEVKFNPTIHFIGYGDLTWPTDGDSVIIVKTQRKVEYMPIEALHRAIGGYYDSKVNSLRQELSSKQTQLFSTLNSTLKQEIEQSVAKELIKQLEALASSQPTAVRSRRSAERDEDTIYAMTKTELEQMIDRVSQQSVNRSNRQLVQDVTSLTREKDQLRSEVQALRSYIQQLVARL